MCRVSCYRVSTHTYTSSHMFLEPVTRHNIAYVDIAYNYAHSTTICHAIIKHYTLVCIVTFYMCIGSMYLYFICTHVVLMNFDFDFDFSFYI